MNPSSDDWPEMILEPIGRVRSDTKEPILLAGKSGLALTRRMEMVRKYHRKVRAGTSELVVFDPWVSLLDGIEGFSHILVLFWPHLIDPARRRLERVHPMGRRDLPEQGIFATCSPARPNPVLVSAVPLVGRRGNVLTVRGLEAVDNSPVVETDACCADAVQVLTGCTFGKGNFIFKDHGKMVFSFFSRKTGRGLRLSMRPGALAPNAEHAALLAKAVAGTADEAEQARFDTLHRQRAEAILEMEEEELFAFMPARFVLPPRAKIEPSRPCARCGEPTMPSKMERIGGQDICRDCM